MNYNTGNTIHVFILQQIKLFEEADLLTFEEILDHIAVEEIWNEDLNFADCTIR